MQTLIKTIQLNKMFIFNCYLEFLLIFGLISRYIEFTKGWNILIACGILLFIYLFKNDIDKKTKWLFFSLLILGILNVLWTRNFDYLLTNLSTLLPGLCIATTVYLALHHTDLFSNFLNKNMLVLNTFYIANIIVLFLQVQGTGFLIKEKWLAINTYYLDQCCGLFGNAGTHELGFYTIFMVIYNFYLTDKIPENKRKLFIGYAVITTLLMLYLSSRNDNMALFVFLPLLVLLYFFLKYFKKLKLIRINKKYGFFLVSGLVVCIVIGAIFNFDSLFINSVLKRLSRVIFFDFSNIAGSNERLAIPLVALAKGNGWLFGQGLGAWMWHKGNYFGFKHFGLSSIGSFIMLGGIWFYLLYTYLFTYLSSFKKNKWFQILFFILLILVSAYSNVYTSAVSLFWIFMILSLLFLLEENKNV